MIELRYILQSLGIEVNTLIIFYEDNKLVYISIITNKGLYKKKHIAIIFYCMREAIVAEIIRPYYVIWKENTVDFLTKAYSHNKYNKSTKLWSNLKYNIESDKEGKLILYLE
jgi:hypothetical protein